MARRALQLLIFHKNAVLMAGKGLIYASHSSIPVGQWHTVNVLEPTVIFESKDGRYGEDG